MGRKLAEFDEESEDQVWISHRAPTNQILQDFEMNNISESLASAVAFGQITARKQLPRKCANQTTTTTTVNSVNFMFLDPIKNKFKPEPTKFWFSMFQCYL